MKLNRYLFISLGLILLAIVLVEFYEPFSNKLRYARNLENVLNQKSEKVEKYFLRLLNTKGDETIRLIEKADKEGLIILKYENDSLTSWSSNAIPIYDFYPDSLYASKVVRLFNSYYYVKKHVEPPVKFIGLVHIKSRYPYENDFLHSGFGKDFKLPDNARILFKSGEGFEIHDKAGVYLFNLLIPEQKAQEGSRGIVATLFLLFGLILFGYYLIATIFKMTDAKKKIFYSIGIVCGILVVRFLQMFFSLGFSHFVLFDPFGYADSFMVPSLGDLLLNSLIVLFIALVIRDNRQIKNFFSAPNQENSKRLFILNLIILLFFIYAHYFFYSIILNSKISFDPSEIDRLSISTFISFLITGINFISFVLIAIWAIEISRASDGFFTIIELLILSSEGVFLVLFMAGYPIDIYSIVFYTLFYLLVLWAGYRPLTNFSFYQFILILFSVYSVVFITINSQIKEQSIRSSIVLGLTNEHDPIAEYLFEDLSREILRDTLIRNKLLNRTADINNLYDYLKKTYYSGYFNKYDIQITICGPADSVLIESPGYKWSDCYEFFNNTVKEDGVALPGSNFYYLDRYPGRISYMARFPYKASWRGNEVSLFIEIDSRLTGEILGYPELLLDEKLHRRKVLDRYSYAKYHRGELVAQYGEFSYSLRSEIFGLNTGKFESVHLDGYEHLIYRPQSENLIALSKPSIQFIDLLITFSYLFLFYYFCLVIISSVGKRNTSGGLLVLSNFRNKIQISIISILLISLFMIAGSTIWLNIRNYKQNQIKQLNEKIQSVLVELSHKLSFEKELTSYWQTDSYDNLNQLLIKFSDVFYTDINLFNPSGDLIATSRIEVFQLGLQGTKMDPVAFYKMHNEQRAEFIHGEHISQLGYMSAYVPFKNAEGKLLAYINLPYFTKQRELQTALSALIVTIVNIYVILILVTISITIIISDQITRPLEMLQLRFRGLKLGGRHEKIEYKRRDEIGNLVDEYNRMVIELDKSVELLARSERESAWREMAKQIAHEIKNPLTPMRLSVQQLQRAWKDQHKDYDKYLERVTGILIEQIDTLSNIASEFSNFAKMPAARDEEVNVLEILRNAVSLFEGTPNFDIKLKTSVERVMISADKEQLSRVFINIIKNGIQSLAEGQEGTIDIEAKLKGEMLEVRIEDNGRGIPEEIKSKMFTPNFTTKSSGMGLGLTIVRNILEHIGATISFESEMGMGSVFIVCFPLNPMIEIRET